MCLMVHLMFGYEQNSWMTVPVSTENVLQKFRYILKVYVCTTENAVLQIAVDEN